MGSRRANAVREWHGMRQKASVVPERRATAADRDATDFIISVMLFVYEGGGVLLCYAIAIVSRVGE
jgi:hypothetical protein